MDISATLASTGACFVYYVRNPSEIYLASDTGVFQGPIPLGVAGSLQNSQCTVNAGASSSSASGNNLTVSLAVSFQPAYAGAKNVYATVSSATVTGSWVQLGTWTVVSSGNSSSPPSPVSVTPNNGTASSQVLSFVFSDADGATAITSVQIDINATLVVSHACYIYYARAPNQLYLANDAGVVQGPLTPGVAGTLQNSQCSLNAGTSSAANSGTNLTLNLALTFASGFAGTKNIYMEAAANSLDSGWIVRGAWLVP
jgi:hypothetical protein